MSDAFSKSYSILTSTKGTSELLLIFSKGILVDYLIVFFRFAFLFLTPSSNKHLWKLAWFDVGSASVLFFNLFWSFWSHQPTRNLAGNGFRESIAPWKI